MWVFGWDRPKGLADVATACRERGYEIPEPDHTAEGDVRTTRAVYEALRFLGRFQGGGGVGSAESAQPVDPAIRDEHAAASYAYDEALNEYEDALASRDPERRASRETALRTAGRRLSQAQSAVVAARNVAPAITFDSLLNDPTQQLDPSGEVLASVLAYQNATTNTPSADVRSSPGAVTP
jgi:hypothetical protein